MTDAVAPNRTELIEALEEIAADPMHRDYVRRAARSAATMLREDALALDTRPTEAELLDAINMHAMRDNAPGVCDAREIIRGVFKGRRASRALGGK